MRNAFELDLGLRGWVLGVSTYLELPLRLVCLEL